MKSIFCLPFEANSHVLSLKEKQQFLGSIAVILCCLFFNIFSFYSDHFFSLAFISQLLCHHAQLNTVFKFNALIAIKRKMKILIVLWGKKRVLCYPIPSPCEDSRKLRITNSVMCLVTQSCPTLCDPMDCSLLGVSVLRILQARILE